MNESFVITKRLLGLGFILLGGAAIVGMVALNLLGLSAYSGIGPTQQKAMLAAGVMIVVGVTLLPLGNRET
ncbi:MAG: hypothetical protein R6X32_02710 [Chloroflexota bacterium]